MNCTDVQRRLYDGSADPGEWRHSDSCASCGRVAARISSLDRLLRETTPPEPPREFWSEQKRRLLPASRSRIPWVLVPLAAAALFALVFWILQPGSDKPIIEDESPENPVVRGNVFCPTRTTTKTRSPPRI